jgi:hypothetical protein
VPYSLNSPQVVARTAKSDPCVYFDFVVLGGNRPGAPAGGSSSARVVRVVASGFAESDRAQALEELERTLPSYVTLLRLAQENRPPQSWYEEAAEPF